MATREDLDNRFAFHPASTPERRDAHESVRAAARVLADAINELVPPGREQATALTKTEEAMYWANAGVARQG